MTFCTVLLVINFYLPLLFILSFVNVNGEKEKEDKTGDIEKKEHQRRVMEAIDDRNWHVSHLKDLDFDGNCEETFHDKVKRYRKALKNDGARVEYVSSDAIPFNTEDMTTKNNKCKVNLTKPKKEKDSTDIVKDKSISGADNIKPVTISVKDIKGSKLNDDIVNISNLRRSEYQFSSVEYYDEFQDFSADVCPDTVEVIELELDTLRSYDVVCEATLEWRSLE